MITCVIIVNTRYEIKADLCCSANLSANKFAIQNADMVCADFFGANGFAFTIVGATAEALVGHLINHVEHPVSLFCISLRQMRHVRNFR